MPQPEEISEETLAGVSALIGTLKVYIPRGNTAHFVRHYPDRDEVYIFCNRYVGKYSGRLYAMNDSKTLDTLSARPCEKCATAIQGTLERFFVLCGRHPSELPAEDEP